MQLKKDDNRGFAVLRKLYKHLCSKKTRIIAAFLIFLVGGLFGMGVSGFFGSIDNPSPIAEEMIKNIISTVGLDPGDTQFILSGFLHENYKIPLKYVMGLKSNPERITIDIKNNDFQKLAYKREIALANGLLWSSDGDYVPAKIHYKDQTVDVKLRLKGRWPCHFDGDKWSLRIKVKGDDTLFGMQVFSINVPKTRNYINEWLLHKTLERDGLIALRDDFIDVTINGKHLGIFELEEHFDKRLIEHNKCREGPIIRFNGGGIDAYQTNKIMGNPNQYEQYIKARDLFESFESGSLETSEVFDIDKFAKFIAISDMMGAQHGFYLCNMRFYYNPITSKIEPIGYDGDTGTKISGLLCEHDKDEVLDCPNLLLENFLKDPIFFEKYVQELERVSQKSYLDGLFRESNEDLQRNLDIIYRDYPYYHFSKDVFYDNQNFINKMLNPTTGLKAYFNHLNTTNGTIILEVGNIQQMPIEILNVSYKESQTFEPKEEMYILHAKLSSEPVQHEKIEFMLPESFNWSDDCIADLRLNYKLLGTSRLRNGTLFPWSHLSEGFLATDFIRQKPNIEKFNFLFVDNASERILVKYGDWELTDSLIIPAGYTVVCVEGTRLDLNNNATVLSYSPLQFFGTEDNPIIISSSDSTGQGIAVLNADEKSVLENVVFKNLSAPSQLGWQLTGVVTFYESPVKIDGCQFSDNKVGDDMINIIRSEFKIKNSLFKHSLSDAIDVDFGKGSISQTSFVDCGNDGMDFSGSVVEVTECFVNGADDKGVSVGENSRVNINKMELKNCYIAAASKDMSQVTITNVKLSTCEVGFTAYQKKSEFGPSAMAVASVDMVNVITPYLIEEGSTLLVDNQKIDTTQKNVWAILYGKK